MADRGGFIVLWRKALDGWLFDLPPGQFKVAIRLLHDANWKDSSAMRGGERITIGRGQALISQRGLADRCGVARGTVGRALTVLEGVNFITTERSTHHTVVTIVNYSKYQDIPTESDGSTDHGRSTVGTTVCTTGDPRSVPIRTREQGNKEQGHPAHPPVSGDLDDPISRILTALSEASGRRYRPTTSSHRKLVEARLAEYSESQLLAVIRDRAKRWRGTEQDEYIRPSTLFRASKFPEYLAVAESNGQRRGGAFG
jgi:uncharacterized phage protein (TIGR02220 family)